MDNKLRADVAIEDKSYCLAVPLVADKWQDVVLTYHKDGGITSDCLDTAENLNYFCSKLCLKLH